MTDKTQNNQTIIDTLLVESGKVLLPLRRLGNEDEFGKNLIGLLQDLGYDVPGNLIPSKVPKLINQVEVLVENLSELIDATSELEKLSAIAKISFSIGEIAHIIVETLVSSIKTSLENIPDFIENSNFEKEFPLRLFDYLIVTHIQNSHSAIFALLQLIGIIELSNQPARDDLFQLEFELRKFHWERLSKIFTNPLELAEEVYQWETSFNSKLFLRHLEAFLRALMIPGGLYRQNNVIRSRLLSQGDEFRMPLFRQGSWLDSYVEFGLSISITESRDSQKGIALIPYAFNRQDNVAVDVAPGWELCFPSNVSLDEPFGILLYPSHNLSYASDLLNEDFLNDPARTPKVFNFNSELKFQRKAQAGKINIIGSDKSTRLYLDGVYITVFARHTDSELDFGLEVGIDDAALIIQSSDGDGFLQKSLPPEPIATHIGLSMGFTNQRGIYLGAQAGLEYRLPLHSSFGPIYLDNISFCLIANIKGLELQTTITAELKLGPLSAVVNNIGLSTAIYFTKPGSLGSSDLDYGFKPPDGAGLAIDTSGIIGGGYLEFDTKNERYAGILALSFGEIALVAIGLIATKLPNGKPGFSMLINIGVIFDPPIQLQYGFTLSGVGGLIGINRTMDTQALQRGFKSRTVDSILMPDPKTLIANAGKIISDLRTVFPPQEDRFVIGPMVKIGWGVPKNIITADIGIFIEIPEPIRIALMGKVRASLPEPEKTIISLNIDILGVLDLERKILSFQARLYDSGILKFALYGDAAFLLSWGERPEFALALGGFHPKYPTPSPNYIFSDLKRLSLNISYDGILMLNCAAFMALTPNSLQFGAAVKLFAAAAGAVVTGNLSFDALILFSPFSFQVAINGAVQVKVHGHSLADIYLSLFLSGPQPWIIRGRARVNILFFSIPVDFSFIWGRLVPVIQPAQDPLPLLQTALSQPASWGAALPKHFTMVEAFREEPADSKTPPDTIIVHPAGILEVWQNIVPLGYTISKFGNSSVTGHNRFRIVSIRINGKPLTKISKRKEYFTRGHYDFLKNHQKLSLPSFEKMVGGISFSSFQTQVNGKSIAKQITYETLLVKSNSTTQKINNESTLSWREIQCCLNQTTTATALLRRNSLQRFSVDRSTIYRQKLRVQETESRTPFYSTGHTPQNTAMPGIRPEVKVIEELCCIVKATNLSLIFDRKLDFGETYCVVYSHNLTPVILDSDVDVNTQNLAREKSEEVARKLNEEYFKTSNFVRAIPMMSRTVADQILKTYRQQHSEQAIDLLIVLSNEVAL